MTDQVPAPGPIATVATGILAVPTRTADGKVGAIVGRRSALAVDAGLDAGEGERVAAAIRSAGHAPDRLIYTHGHGDHCRGGDPFRDGLILAHVDAAAHILRQITTWAEAGGEPADGVASRLALPSLTFTSDLTLDLGEREVRVLVTPGHAPGAVCVFVPDARVLFGGDTVVTGIPPNFKDGDSRILESTLRRLAVLDAETLVPGHGPVVQGAAAVRAAILWAADYLARVRERVAARVGRDDVDAIVASVPFDTLIGDHLPKDRHRMEWRHEQTVRSILAELLDAARA